MTGMRVYLEECGTPARERLGFLVDEVKAANDLAPVTVVPPEPLRWNVAQAHACQQKRPVQRPLPDGGWSC